MRSQIRTRRLLSFFLPARQINVYTATSALLDIQPVAQWMLAGSSMSRRKKRSGLALWKADPAVNQSDTTNEKAKSATALKLCSSTQGLTVGRVTLRQNSDSLILNHLTLCVSHLQAMFPGPKPQWAMPVYEGLKSIISMISKPNAIPAVIGFPAISVWTSGLNYFLTATVVLNSR